LRFTLDTVGRIEWPRDAQGRAVYPEGFEELANKLRRPLHPPGRDVRCVIFVGMLTEGWDCNTVTHIVGLRPFMSQLLCEQVVGRGLRRTNYTDFDDDGKLVEEVAKVFGVPFEVIPFKETGSGGGGARRCNGLDADPRYTSLRAIHSAASGVKLTSPPRSRPSLLGRDCVCHVRSAYVGEVNFRPKTRAPKVASVR
jgi:hypothetical protein